jgi:hypothetical protein
MWQVTVLALLALPIKCLGRNLFKRKKSLAQWNMLDSTQDKSHDHKHTLVPGINELGGGVAINKFALTIGIEPHPMDKYRSGDPKKDTCQPWEDCGSQGIGNRSVSEVTTTPEPTMNITKSGNVKLFNVSNVTDDGKDAKLCHEWDLTKQGCQCLDACECNRRNPRFGGEKGFCKTAHIRTLSFTNRENLHPCGDLDMASGDFYDSCSPTLAPTVEPRMAFIPPVKLKGNDTLYRDYNGPKNKRFLPKSSCFSRDYYCATFPAFKGCVPGLTYKYSEEIDEEIKTCKAIEDQKKCEAKEKCGKGKHATCHPICVYSEDAPGWFREMRGKQNQWLKRNQRDPAVVGGPRRYSPVLQPAWDGRTQRGAWESGDEIVKKPTEWAGATTTPPPDGFYYPAGILGHGRSAGFVRASDVGKNVGNDMSFNRDDDGPQEFDEPALYVGMEPYLSNQAQGAGNGPPPMPSSPSLGKVEPKFRRPPPIALAMREVQPPSSATFSSALGDKAR